MAKVEIAILFLFSLFWVAMPNRLPVISAHRSFCASQFNLVNYACATLQVVPFPPPSHSHSHGHSRSTRRSHGHNSSSHDHSSSSRRNRNRSRQRRHRHRRGHRHRHETDAQSFCCQWLKQVDTECVCDVLVHLPMFLSRPYHQYTIVVGDACTVKFTCPGRLVP